MSIFSRRTALAAGLITAVILSGCSSSESSKVRTRNNATDNTCMNIGLDTTDAYLSAYIPPSDCAVGLVELSERHYPEDLSSGNTLPSADQETPGFQNLHFFHGFNDFDIAFEARDANNVPVEYVRAKGNGGDPNSVVYARSTISPVSIDSSCVKPVNTADYLGFSTECDNEGGNFTYLITLVRGEEDGQRRLMYQRTTNEMVYSWDIATDRFRYLSVVSLKDDQIHSKMVIAKSNDTTLEAKAYKYSVPTLSNQATEETPVDDETTTTTLQDESTSTTIGDETTSTTPTEDSSSTTVEAPEATTATKESIEEACGALDGVEIFPGIDSWKESTQFEITLDNDCLRAIQNGELSGTWANHRLTATNQNDGRKAWFRSTTNENQKILFTGSLYTGQWKIAIEQFVYGGSLPTPINTMVAFPVDVTSDPEKPWKVCASEDIDWDGTTLALDCTYSQAIAMYPHSNQEDSQAVLVAGERVKLEDLNPGWQPVSIQVNVNGFISYLNLTLCSTDCSDLPSAVDAKVVRNATSVTITSQSNSCSVEELPIVAIHYLNRVNDKLMVHVPRTINAFVDALIQEDSSTTLQIPKDVDHILAFRNVNSDIRACIDLTNLNNLQWSIISIPEEVTDSAEAPETTVSKSPAVMTDIEFTRTNSVGTPVVVSSDQTVIEIPALTLPASLFTDESNVVSIAVRTGNSKWTPVSKSIPTLVSISDNARDVQVRYTFADGSESIVTKPIQDAAEYEQKIAESSSSSSNTLLYVLLGLGVLVVAGGATVVLRRKN